MAYIIQHDSTVFFEFSSYFTTLKNVLAVYGATFKPNHAVVGKIKADVLSQGTPIPSLSILLPGGLH